MRKWRARRWYLGWTLVLLINFETINCAKEKRQIFREQVLPALGGKIPEEAFRTDRLALNRLNKEGITVVDGVILEARHVDKHPTHVHARPEVIKVYATLDGRYTPPEGRYRYDQPKTVDTTYVIRKPTGHSVNRLDHYRDSAYRPVVKPHGYANFHRYIPVPTPIQPQIYKPIIRPLVLPAKEILFSGHYYDPSWNNPYDWSFRSHGPLDGFYYENMPFDTHQIITDYEGFLNDFHERRLRYSENPANSNAIRSTTKQANAPGTLESNKSNSPISTKSLTSIPTTGFSCQGKRGTFADVETNCQVFHECSGWTKTSSLCPPGTAYSEELKRCEWANQVNCSS